MTAGVTASVFVGASLDGFIARANHDIDWLTGGSEEEPHGYEEFIAGIDVIVMGRKSFEKVMTFDKWYYGTKRVVVLSHTPLDLAPARARGAVVDQLSGTPAEIVAQLAAQGAKNLYVDGGKTIQEFLRAGLIQRIIVTRVPVLIGQGISLFGPLSQDVRLRHVNTRTYKGGAVQSEYQVIP